MDNKLVNLKTLIDSAYFKFPKINKNVPVFVNKCFQNANPVTIVHSWLKSGAFL